MLIELLNTDIDDGRWQNEDILQQLDTCQGIILGCPTYMGSISVPMKAFMDGCLQRYYQRSWVNKLAAAFTVSTTPAGDKHNSLNSIMLFAMQQGMLWVGQEHTSLNADNLNRLGIYLGAAGQADYQSDPPGLITGDGATGNALG